MDKLREQFSISFKSDSPSKFSLVTQNFLDDLFRSVNWWKKTQNGSVISFLFKSFLFCHHLCHLHIFINYYLIVILAGYGVFNPRANNSCYPTLQQASGHLVTLFSNTASTCSTVTDHYYIQDMGLEYIINRLSTRCSLYPTQNNLISRARHQPFQTSLLYSSFIIVLLSVKEASRPKL